MASRTVQRMLIARDSASGKYSKVVREHAQQPTWPFMMANAGAGVAGAGI